MSSKYFEYFSSKRFFKRSRAANSAVHGWIWPKFELIQDFTVDLVTCKNEEDLIKNEGARVFTELHIDFSDAQGQVTSQWSDLVKIRTHPSLYACPCFLQE